MIDLPQRQAPLTDVYTSALLILTPKAPGVDDYRKLRKRAREYVAHYSFPYFDDLFSIPVSLALGAPELYFSR